MQWRGSFQVRPDKGFFCCWKLWKHINVQIGVQYFSASLRVGACGQVSFIFLSETLHSLYLSFQFNFFQFSFFTYLQTSAPALTSLSATWGIMLDLIKNAAWAESIRFSSSIRMILSSTCNRCIGRTGAHQVHRLGSCIRLSCYLCNCNILSGLRDGAVFLNYFKAILSHSWYDWWHSTHKAKLWARLKERSNENCFKSGKSVYQSVAAPPLKYFCPIF